MLSSQLAKSKLPVSLFVSKHFSSFPLSVSSTANPYSLPMSFNGSITSTLTYLAVNRIIQIFPKINIFISPPPSCLSSSSFYYFLTTPHPFPASSSLLLTPPSTTASPCCLAKQASSTAGLMIGAGS